MLLRDAQEQTRILYAAQRNSRRGGGDPVTRHASEAAAILETLVSEPTNWKQSIADPTRSVALLTVGALGVANELKVDSLKALESFLVEKSP